MAHQELLLLTGIAVTAGFYSHYFDIEASLAFDLPLEFLKERAFEFLNPAALEAGQVNMVTTGACFVIVFSTAQVHEVKLVHQPVFLQHG